MRRSGNPGLRVYLCQAPQALETPIFHSENICKSEAPLTLTVFANRRLTYPHFNRRV